MLHILPGQHHRAVLHGFTAQGAPLGMHNTEFVVPFVLGNKRPVIHQYGFPTVIPFQPEIQHRHRCHTGNAQAHAVRQLQLTHALQALVQE